MHINGGTKGFAPRWQWNRPSSYRWWHWLIMVVVVLVVAGLVIAASLSARYFSGLEPLKPGSEDVVNVEVIPGMGPNQIGKLLQEEEVIKDSWVFNTYVSLNRVGNKLQAGLYQLSPGLSVSEIVDQLVKGSVQLYKVTFLPGATLAMNRQALIDAGFPESEVDAALGKDYEGVLFTDKPANTDLEGYLFGDTYFFGAGTSVETILQQAFDEFTKVIEDNDLINKFKAHDLTLYEGITLASIVQREVSGEDQPQVAQVFQTRLKIGMMLGSDVTYEYAAKKMGVAATPSLDSPYNTRLYAGLPPGPIAVPGVAALLATANPAEGDYLYFLSGDDEKTYFAHTNDEHEANIVNHCQQKCLLVQ